MLQFWFVGFYDGAEQALEEKPSRCLVAAFVVGEYNLKVSISDPV